MRITKLQFMSHIYNALVGKRCWHVCADAFPPAFQLALGRKVKRTMPLKNRSLPRTYRLNEGEANLMVWSAWRLQKTGRIISSSDDIETRAISSIESVIGTTISTVTVVQPAWDLVIEFDDGVTLQLFCDRVERSRDNWEIFEGVKMIFAGPGSKFGVTDQK